MTVATDISKSEQAPRKARAKATAVPAQQKLADTPAAPKVTVPQPAAAPEHPRMKIAAVIALLQRDAGASLVELATETGWLPHTVRAALTGLRKRGMTVTRAKIGDETRYSVDRAAA